MPRDASGNYTLVAGNPVITDTLITSTWANSTLPDIANALTDSLDRQGRGGMLAPFLFADGTKLSPAMTFTSEPTMGFFRRDAGELAVAITGDEWVLFNAANQLQVWREAAWRTVLDAGSAQMVTGAMTFSGDNSFTGANTFTSAPTKDGDAFITEAPIDTKQYVRQDAAWAEIVPEFLSGDTLAFFQASAPVGYTQVTDPAVDNAMLRVVSVAGGGNGGSDSPILNDKVPSHTHTGSTNTTGAHTHSYTGVGGGNGVEGGAGMQYPPPTYQTGSNGNHAHTLNVNANASAANWTPKYVDMIICSKD